MILKINIDRDAISESVAKAVGNWLTNVLVEHAENHEWHQSHLEIGGVTTVQVDVNPQPAEVEFILIGPGYWGIGDTIHEAKENMRKNGADARSITASVAFACPKGKCYFDPESVSVRYQGVDEYSELPFRTTEVK